MADRPLTADELPQHPEYNHTVWDLRPEQKGKLAVARGRGGPLDIAYEVHGHGNLHLVVGGASSIFSNASIPERRKAQQQFVMARVWPCPYTARRLHPLHQ
jgi:hypothetical protein